MMAHKAVADAVTTTLDNHGKHKMPCHSGMPGMNHGNMGGMPGMDHGKMDPGMKMCSMKMTLNSDYENLCLLTENLMVTNKYQLVVAIFGIILFTFGYEYYKRFVDRAQNRYNLYLRSDVVVEKERKKHKAKLSVMYGLSVFYSFIIMLLFMTFNVWVMIAVCVGAGLGHYLLDSSAPAAVSLSCH